MKRIKVARTSDPLNWWSDCVGQECPVLDIYEPTGYIKIRVIRKEPAFIDPNYEIEGWIPPEFVDIIE